MPIILKSRREIEMMRRSGQLAHSILQKMEAAVAPGVTTSQLNEIARVELDAVGAIATSKNYPTYKPGEGYPAETCISVNDEVVHGIPTDQRPLKTGDIVSLDLALKYEGFCADTAITVGVGQITPANQKLLDITRKTLELALRLIRPGVRWSDRSRWTIRRRRPCSCSASWGSWCGGCSPRSPGTRATPRCGRSTRAPSGTAAAPR